MKFINEIGRGEDNLIRLVKVLPNKIRLVIYDAIDRNQYAFFKGRQILDCILIANKSVEGYRRRKQKGVIIKIDLEKAYDKTDWDFLDFVLARKGFGSNGDLGFLDVFLLFISRLFLMGPQRFLSGY